MKYLSHSAHITIMVASAAVLLFSTTWAAAPPDLSGVWQVTKYEHSIRTVDGKMPPLKPRWNRVKGIKCHHYERTFRFQPIT